MFAKALHSYFSAEKNINLFWEAVYPNWLGRKNEVWFLEKLNKSWSTAVFSLLKQMVPGVPVPQDPMMCNFSTLLSPNPKTDFLRSLLISKENGWLFGKSDILSCFILALKYLVSATYTQSVDQNRQLHHQWFSGTPV